MLDLLVAKTKAGSEDLPDPPNLDILARVFLDLVLDLLGFPDVLRADEERLSGVLDPLVDGIGLRLLLR